MFIEPAEVVEANNRIRELEGDERREIIRILVEFSNLLRPSIPEVLQSYEFLAEIDFIRAKSLFALQISGIKPALEIHAYWIGPWQSIRYYNSPSPNMGKGSSPRYRTNRETAHIDYIRSKRRW